MCEIFINTLSVGDTHRDIDYSIAGKHTIDTLY